MSVTPIRNPLPGERVVGLSPAPEARVTDWNRRLNLFTGRALSATALTAEQQGRAGRLALRGQMVSPGVVLGLEVGLETEGEKHFLHIGAGFGITASGEDVIVPKLARVLLRALPVYATAALLDGAPDVGAGELAVRRLGAALGDLIESDVAVPKVGIIVLEPMLVDERANFDDTDPCEEDPSNDPFSDEQYLDGCRLAYYAWPTEWLLLPVADDRWRNRLAYAIFDRESSNGPEEVLPWELVGLPIGLVAFDDDWAPLFVDRYAVVRHGGKSKRCMPLAPGMEMDFLWQARIEQFAAQVVDLDPGATAADLANEVRYLPPTGLLPTSALTLQTGSAADSRVAGTSFFPGSYAINAVPAPLEQLDLVARASASLAAFDTFTPDQVTVIVPVPQIWYEPDLLRVLAIDPVFQQTVDEFMHQRALWMKRRQDVRTAYSALVAAMKGTPPTFPDPDPDAVEPNEEVAATEIDPSIDAFSVAEKAYGTTGPGALTVDDVRDLKTNLSQMPGVKDEVGQLDALGLEKFAAQLQTKADTANDKIDLGFLRVQTDIYRTRQKMLSTEAATRLAVSPALASIAQGASALATRDDIETFLTKAKATLVPTGPSGAPPHAAPPSPAPPQKAGGTAALHFAGGPATFLAGGVVDSRIETEVRAGAATAEIGTAGVALARTATDAESVRAIAGGGTAELFAGAAASRLTEGDITQQRAIVGGGYNLRTVSVVERLQDPPTAEVMQFTVASKVSAISTFKNVGISVGDIEIPGFRDGDNEVTKPLGQVDNVVLGQVLAGTHDTFPKNAHESDIFAAGVRAMENTIDILRLMESRVQLYQRAAELCRTAIASVNGNATAAAARLQAIANDLSKTRHDVSVAKALMAEEQERIDRINDRRDQIVTEQVRFLAYYRPRTVEALSAMPQRVLDPGVTVPSIPACLARNVTAPDELRAFVNLLRDAPLAWFRHIPILIDKLDRLDVLHTAVVNAKRRASFTVFDTPPATVQTAPGALGAQVLKVFAAQQQVVTQKRIATAQLDLTTIAGRTWTESRDRARQLLSIGDLLDVGHYHPEVPRVSAAEIENIVKVAACLYSDFSAVLPVIRLNWAERLIQVDGPVNLANLGSLPRWGEIPILERKEMQALVDWLFSRINSAEPEAVAHINDLVRVCILLASHAPVADIIAGDVIRDTTVTPGARIDLTADLGRVRLGMHVLLYNGSQAVARGVVENLASGVATARVLTAASPGITIPKSAKAHFAQADAFDRNPLTASLKL